MKYAIYDDQTFLDRNGSIVGRFSLFTELSEAEYMRILAKRTGEEVSINDSCSGS